MGMLQPGIRRRLLAGFGLLVALNLAMAGFGVWQLTSVNEEIVRLGALSDNNTRVMQISRQLEVVRRATLRYKVYAEEAALHEAGQATAESLALLDEVTKATRSDALRSAFMSARAALAAFGEMRDELAVLVGRIQTQRAKLFSGGDEMTANTDKLFIASRQIENHEISSAAPEVRAAIFLVRIANWRFLGTRDAKGPATFKANAEKATAALARLEAMDLPPEFRALIAPVKSSLAAYAGSFDAVADAMLQSDKLYDDRIVPDLKALIATTAVARESLTRDYAATTAATGGEIAWTILLQKGVAVLALVLGIVVALLVGRSIVRPVRGMTAAMQLLAKGDTSAEIPSRDGRDEIGAMAKAVEVFRENMLERGRLQTAQQEQQTKSEADRHAALLGMADTVEARTMSVLRDVSDRGDTMATLADAMRDSAARTGTSAEAAASAAAQALANAQTVASAAEELASSIREIGGQVGQSTAIVARAVDAGSETRTTIEALNERVGRIGAVADMIGEIAAKTNLLALNATIEAARAGDAGKGFAVVASEVKQLATQTARSTEEISRHIAEVRAATGASVAAVGRIEQTITEINAIAGSIAAAVEQQGAATAEIARNVTETATAANEMTSRIGEVSAEAGETGGHAAKVHETARGLADAMSELKHAVVRAVRTSTAEVDRRETARHAVDIAGRVTVAGQGTQTARISDIGEGGARLHNMPALPQGSRGTLAPDGFGVALPFTVLRAEDGSASVGFELDVAAANALRSILERLAPRRAA